jgi:hypothetical protein
MSEKRRMHDGRRSYRYVRMDTVRVRTTVVALRVVRCGACSGYEVVHSTKVLVLFLSLKYLVQKSGLLASLL